MTPLPEKVEDVVVALLFMIVMPSMIDGVMGDNFRCCRRLCRIVVVTVLSVHCIALMQAMSHVVSAELYALTGDVKELTFS